VKQKLKKCLLFPSSYGITIDTVKHAEKIERRTPPPPGNRDKFPGKGGSHGVESVIQGRNGDAPT
jgi:hypothetical protein